MKSNDNLNKNNPKNERKLEILSLELTSKI